VARVWTAIAILLGGLGLGVGCGDDDDAADAADGAIPRDDGGRKPVDPPSTMNDAAVGGAGTGPPAGGTGGWMFVPPPPPPNVSLCTLSVAAQCDGPEDCEVPQSCCAEYDPLRLTYSSIGCRLNCDRSTQFELCHVEQGGCKRSGHTCRRSLIIPHDFITVCSNTPAPPAASTSQALDGLIVCGSDRCVAGVEECCLRSTFDFTNRMSVPLDPYCAPLGSACTCSSMMPGTGDEDGGMVSG
jgi:hypothetical protein